MWPVSHCLAAAWPSVTSKWQFRSWACELKTKTWKRAIGRNDPLCASPTGVPRLHQTRVVLRVREPDRQHFCFSSKWIHLKPLKIGATARAWRALRPSSDSAHRGVLQQHHVGPLLFGNHAVAHPEGWNVRRAASQPLVNPPSVMKGRVFCVQISWLLQITMGTSPTETLSVAGNIFVGQVLWHPPESGVAQKHQVFTLFNPLFFSLIRLRLHYWFARTWRTWPNLRFTLWWPAVLPPLRAASWGPSSHLGWDEADAQVYLG